MRRDHQATLFKKTERSSYTCRRKRSAASECRLSPLEDRLSFELDRRESALSNAGAKASALSFDGNLDGGSGVVTTGSPVGGEPPFLAAAAVAASMTLAVHALDGVGFSISTSTGPVQSPAELPVDDLVL